MGGSGAGSEVGSGVGTGSGVGVSVVDGSDSDAASDTASGKSAKMRGIPYPPKKATEAPKIDCINAPLMLLEGSKGSRMIMPTMAETMIPTPMNAMMTEIIGMIVGKRFIVSPGFVSAVWVHTALVHAQTKRSQNFLIKLGNFGFSILVSNRFIPSR